jgi:hypothetical protein
VQWIRHAYRTATPGPYYHPGELSVAQAASVLNTSIGVVYYWINNAQLDARRGKGNRLCIPWNPTIEAACRRRIAASGHLTPAPATPNTTAGGAV